MIILDTNFLIYALKYRIAQQLEEFKGELAVPAQVIEELEKLSMIGKVADREAAKIALVFLEKWNVKVLDAGGNADEAIESLAVENKAKVATMDKLLAKRLKKSKIQILKIRQKKRIIKD